MKLPASLIRRLPISASLLFAAVAPFTFTSCSKQNQEKATTAVKNTYDDSKAAMSRGWENVKSFAYEKRTEFAARAQELSAQMEVQAAEVRAKYSDTKASASRKAAMEELKNSEADYKEKLRALGNATAATWDQAKQNVILAWERLEAAIKKARAD